MRWKKGRRSSNIEDRRGQGGMGRGGSGLPGGMRIPIGGGKGGGCTTILIMLAAFYFLSNSGLFSGGGLTNSAGTSSNSGYSDGSQIQLPDVFSSPNQAQTRQNQQNPYARQQQTSGQNAPRDVIKDFVSVVLADTEETWHKIFQQMGSRYREPKLVLFSGVVRSACGMAQSASGPFYCPADQKLYIDPVFYEQLERRHNAPGDFAQAYVIAHEVGHHVQTLLGISQQVQDYQRRAGKVKANQMLVRLELQSDCFAGLWANHAHRSRQILEEGDIEEALNAAAQIGDDTLQRQSQGYVVPESFTHGTAQQRVTWFKRGLQSGNIQNCDTFNTRQL